MKLHAALKKHRGASAINVSTLTPIQVIRLWSYCAGRWVETFEVVGVTLATCESSSRQRFEDVAAVERALAQAFARDDAPALDPDAWV